MRAWRVTAQVIMWVLIGIGAVVAILSLIAPSWVVAPTLGKWPSEDWRAGLDLKTQIEFVTTVRNSALLIAGGTIAVATLVLSSLRDAHVRRAHADTHQLAIDADTTTRYTQAIGQLGDANSIAIRLGGIYALERIAKDSIRDRATIVEVLAAFTRTQSQGTADDVERPPEDVGAALAVLIRMERGETPINLSGARLRGANLAGGNFRGGNFDKALLDNADLSGADMTDASFRYTQMVSTIVRGAKFDRAVFWEADPGYMNERSEYGDERPTSFRGTQFNGSNFVGSALNGSDFTGADLQTMGSGWDARGGNFTNAVIVTSFFSCSLDRAVFDGADIRWTNVDQARLHGADFSKVKQANIYWQEPNGNWSGRGAYYDADTKWPPGMDPLPPNANQT